MYSPSRYLIPESIELIKDFVTTHPLLGSLLLLGVFGAILGILRRTFGRIAPDMILFAAILWAIVMLFGSAIFTLTHVKGYHFGG